MYYLFSRYYNPVICRFVNTDNLIGSNLYEYCNSSPITQIDPDGKAAISIALSLLTVVGLLGSAIAGSVSSKKAQKVEAPKNKIYDFNPFRIGIALIGLTAATIVTAKKKSQERKGDGAIYSVYFLAPSNTSDDIKYVGRVKSNNFTQRMKYHEKTRHLYPRHVVEGLTYEEARGLEERGMIACHTLKGKRPYNIIHGISPINPNQDMYYFDTLGYLENKATAYLLNLLDGGL